uniref:Uncharacterized protein n=1 Tax=Xenopus tropicalis TaxID=8364 RepID=A0A6I8RRT9_XENTR
CIMGPILVLLAVIVANQVLLGRKVLPVRCKGINISATSAAINLCTSHSCIRQQETRLQATLGRLKVFDGIPPPHERRKRMVVPDDGAPEANTEVCFPCTEGFMLQNNDFPERTYQTTRRTEKDSTVKGRPVTYTYCTPWHL